MVKLASLLMLKPDSLVASLCHSVSGPASVETITCLKSALVARTGGTPEFVERERLGPRAAVPSEGLKSHFNPRAVDLLVVHRKAAHITVLQPHGQW